MAPYRGAVGSVGRARGAQAGLGECRQGRGNAGRARELPGHCIVSSDPGRGKGSCQAAVGGEGPESGFPSAVE